MINKNVTMALIAFAAIGASAQTVTVRSTVQLVDSAAYFPQLNADGTRLLYSNTEASTLSMLDIPTGHTSVVCNEGFPGFDAQFAPNGKVYYVTQERRDGNLIYRTGHEFNPATARHRVVLKPQHGAVRPVQATSGFALVGENKAFTTGGNIGKGAYTAGATVVTFDRNPKLSTVLKPITGTVGLLWASYSPDGSKLMFEAVAKGVYVIDLKRYTITNIGFYLMPSWFGNDYIVAMSNNNSAVQRVNGYHNQIMLLGADGKYVHELTPQGFIQPACKTVEIATDGTTVGNIVYTTSHGTVSMQQIEVKP